MNDSVSGAMRDQISFGDGKVRRSVLNPVVGDASNTMGLLTSSTDPGAARQNALDPTVLRDRSNA